MCAMEMYKNYYEKLYNYRQLMTTDQDVGELTVEMLHNMTKSWN